MDLHSENVQTGLPRPDADAGIEPATTENIDFDYEILDVESQILDVAATLAIQTGGITSCFKLYSQFWDDASKMRKAFIGTRPRNSSRWTDVE